MIALVVLLVLSLLAAALMLSINVESDISAHDERRTRALSIAEAGVAEGISRIRSGDVPDTLNPKMTTQIFLVSAGSVPLLGTDSTAIPTAQPAGKWLNYSMAARGSQVLTVTYKTDAARTKIYRYDVTQNPAVQTVSGAPIFVVTATGRVGSDVHTVVSEVFKRPLQVPVNGALTANAEVHYIGGNAAVCGYNHSFNTPTGAGDAGRFAANTCVTYELGTNDIVGCWASDSVYSNGVSTEAGNPVPDMSYQTGYPTSPWALLGMSQAEFLAWIGPPNDPAPATLNGPIYLDNDAITQNHTGSWNIGSSVGEGFLYADGDISISSGFTYKGLIYVEGDLSFSGHGWVLGAVFAQGAVHLIKLGGGGTILDSKDAINNALNKYGKVSTLSYREK